MEMAVEALGGGLQSQDTSREYGFIVSQQKLELNIDFATRSLSGHTEIKILPEHSRLRVIRLDARLCRIAKVEVNGFKAAFEYEDPYAAVTVPQNRLWDATNHSAQMDRLQKLLDTRPATGCLEIKLPAKVVLTELDPLSSQADTALRNRVAEVAARASVDIGSATPLTPKIAIEQTSKYQPITISIDFTTTSFRDGVHWVGLDEGDSRYPHVYTRHSMDPGTASCIFPCVDDQTMRCAWEVVIRCARTLGDAFKRRTTETQAKDIYPGQVLLSEQEKLMEMVVVCSGEQLTEIVDHHDSSKKVVSYRLDRIVAPQHIGFAIGPFENVNLAEFRDEDDERMTQNQAIPMYGYCLPGRTEELRHTGSPMASALDYFLFAFGVFPFPEFKFVFVEDLGSDTLHTASLAFCSTRLLYGPHILDPEITVTRKLVHAVATQWIGVGIVPSTPSDRWITIGISYYMADLFIKALCGNNELAFRIREDVDRLTAQDVGRPGLVAMGSLLHHGSSQYDFMALKAPLVLHILDRRIMKAQALTGIGRVISKIIVNANTSEGSEGLLGSDSFRKLCERITKYRDTESFWQNYVHGAGVPRLQCSQRYNKKKTCIEFSYRQIQSKADLDRPLAKEDFWRDALDLEAEYDLPSPQAVFKGSMTVRIHGADGTPYDHMIDVSKESGKVDINYNTKYKRLKRSRRAKERAIAGTAMDVTTDSHDDVLIYCLGDVLQSPEEVTEWNLSEWSATIEQEMEQEAYEWLRVDADFEWLGEKAIDGMPAYMVMSQLQQDKDVMAHYDSLKFLYDSLPHPLCSTFLVRTLMDRRYFYGIRKMAATYLEKQNGGELGFLGLNHLRKAFSELYCHPGTDTPRPNNFADKQSYLIECSIPHAVARIRGSDGRCPREARDFLLVQLRFNDNSSNEYSEDFKLANLLSALTDSLLPAHTASNEISLWDDEEEDPLWNTYRDTVMEELDRYGRIDEWNMSYQNIFTVTVLACKHRLMKEKVIPVDPMEFARYLHDGTADVVRVKAFWALADLAYLRQGSFSCFLIDVLSTDPSPYVREQLFHVFTVGLATIAFGEHLTVDKAKRTDDDGLVVEQEAVLAAELEMKKAALARKTDIHAALDALKHELQNDELIKEALWEAVKSPIISVTEQVRLLQVCGRLYTPSERDIIKLRLPRYPTMEHTGKVRFIQSCRFINNI